MSSDELIGRLTQVSIVDFGFGSFSPTQALVGSSGGTAEYSSPEKTDVSSITALVARRCNCSLGRTGFTIQKWRTFGLWVSSC